MIKEILKALNSKVYHLLVLHKDLPRTIKENLTALKPGELPTNKEQTHLCSKIVRRFMGRGEKPVKPGDSYPEETI